MLSIPEWPLETRAVSMTLLDYFANLLWPLSGPDITVQNELFLFSRKVEDQRFEKSLATIGLPKPLFKQISCRTEMLLRVRR